MALERDAFDRILFFGLLLLPISSLVFFNSLLLTTGSLVFEKGDALGFYRPIATGVKLKLLFFVKSFDILNMFI
jgi:hypothetical protein